MSTLHDFAGAVLGSLFAGAAVAYTAGVATKRASRRRADVAAAAARLPLLQPWEEVTQEDLACVARARALLRRTPRPIYSDFLVAAVIAYVDGDGATRFVEGVNSETSVLASAICAERCALLQLRLRPSFGAIKAVYITTLSAGDEAHPPGPRRTGGGVLITPGLLCREMLSAYGPAGTRVFLFTHDWAPAPDETGASGGHSSRMDAAGRHAVYRLGDLYPHPPLYNGVPRGRLPAHAGTFATRASPFAPPHIDARGFVPTPGSRLSADVAAAAAAPGAEAGAGLGVVEAALARLHAHLTAVAAAPDPADQLYPVNLAAGALLADGGTISAREDKGLEYGCTVEAPVKLAAALLAAARRGVRPLAVLVVDQWGVLHAPSARARSWLYERGFGATAVFVHDAAGGGVVRTTAERLSPAVPLIHLGGAGGGEGKGAAATTAGGGGRAGGGDAPHAHAPAASHGLCCECAGGKP